MLLDDTVDASTAGELNSMLAALPQLTALCLSFECKPMLPQAMTHLAQLQCFAFRAVRVEFEGVLPGGPWLGSMRRMLLPARLAAASIHVLQAARQLESLGLGLSEPWFWPPPEQGDAVTRLLQFASGHAPLRSLQLDGSLAVEPADVAAAVQHAPLLSISTAQSWHSFLLAVAPDFADTWWD